MHTHLGIAGPHTNAGAESGELGQGGGVAGGEPDFVWQYSSDARSSPAAHECLSTRRASNSRRTQDIIEQRNAKSSKAPCLRDRSSPACTLSQDGYGTDAHVSNHVVQFVIFDS